MTGQIPDRIIYHDEPHEIVGIKGKGLLTPGDFGISPTMMSTACYRGYYCDYEVKDNRLLLSHLVVSAADDIYPLIGTVQPIVEEDRVLEEDAPEPELLRGMSIGRLYSSEYHGVKHLSYDGAIYAQLSVPTDFSGGILIAKDFIASMYVHMGFQKPTSFEHVIELLCEDGLVAKAVDHSAKIAEIRAELLKPRQVPKYDDELTRIDHISGWIEAMFSLDYDLP